MQNRAESSLPTRTKGKDRWAFICWFIAALNILNGIWMLLAPAHWYVHLPAGVPEYGPLNVHFIRDIGCTFSLLGLGLIVAGLYPLFRLPLFSMNTLFYLMHMLVHVHEVTSGRIRFSMFWTDLPAVYAPAIVFLMMNVVLLRKFRQESEAYNGRL